MITIDLVATRIPLASGRYADVFPNKPTVWIFGSNLATRVHSFIPLEKDQLVKFGRFMQQSQTKDVDLGAKIEAHWDGYHTIILTHPVISVFLTTGEVSQIMDEVIKLTGHHFTRRKYRL
jgi:hypothetical protein